MALMLGELPAGGSTHLQVHGTYTNRVRFAGILSLMTGLDGISWTFENCKRTTISYAG